MKKLTKNDKLKELDKLVKQTSKLTKKSNMTPKKVKGVISDKTVQCLICKGFFFKQDCVTVRNKGKIEGYFCPECILKVKQGVFPQPSPFIPAIPNPVIEPPERWDRPIPVPDDIKPWEPWTDPNIKWETSYDVSSMRTLIRNNKGDNYTIDDIELIKLNK